VLRKSLTKSRKFGVEWGEGDLEAADARMRRRCETEMAASER
jgi:hypothetical protein